jgi:hypothetical protein
MIDIPWFSADPETTKDLLVAEQDAYQKFVSYSPQDEDFGKYCRTAILYSVSNEKIYEKGF